MLGLTASNRWGIAMEVALDRFVPSVEIASMKMPAHGRGKRKSQDDSTVIQHGSGHNPSFRSTGNRQHESRLFNRLRRYRAAERPLQRYYVSHKRENLFSQMP